MLNYFIYYHNSVNDLNMKETMYNLYKNMLMSIFAHILISVFYFLVVPLGGTGGAGNFFGMAPRTLAAS